jgi:hypothetical protein
MDRKERPAPARPSRFANEGEVADRDVPALDGPAGREDDHGDIAEGAFKDATDDVSTARPRGDVTGRHDPGSGANETDDGLSDTEEAVRREAEDEPVGVPGSGDGVPVFDRAEIIRKL